MIVKVLMAEKVFLINTIFLINCQAAFISLPYALDLKTQTRTLQN